MFRHESMGPTLMERPSHCTYRTYDQGETMISLEGIILNMSYPSDRDFGLRDRLRPKHLLR